MAVGDGSIYTGANFLMQFGRENTFNAGSSGGYSFGLMGAGTKLSTFSAKNNFEPVYSLGSRTPATFYSKGVAVDLTGEFFLTSDEKDWLDYVLTGAGGSSTTSNTSWSAGLSVNSGYSIIQEVLNGSVANTYTVSGIAYDTARLNVKQGELATVTLTGTGTALSSATGQTELTSSPSANILSWKDVGVKIGSSLSSFTTPIQSLDMTIGTSRQLVYGFDTLEYQNYYLKQFEVSGTLEVYHDSGILETIYEDGIATNNSSFTLTDELEITIGGGATPAYTFTIGGLARNSLEVDIQPVNPVVDKLSFIGQSLTVS